MNEDLIFLEFFELPDELAKELSNLLTKQVIQERLLQQVVDDSEQFEKVMNKLMPITAKIEAIKIKITKEYVPNDYRSSQYIWNYDGYEVDGNKAQILTSVTQ